MWLAAKAITTAMAGIVIRMISGGPNLSWLYRTLSWTSPSWPIGSFAYSSGLEWAHEAGWLSDAAAVELWLRECLQSGSLSNEAAVFAQGWNSVQTEDGLNFADLAELVMALQGSAERALETSAQGAAFRRIAIAANQEAHGAELAWYSSKVGGIPDDELPYPLAASALFAAFHVPLDMALTAYLHAAIANLVSAAQRIVPLGHTEAQVLLVRLEAKVSATVSRAVEACDRPLIELLSSTTLAADIACMRHETQYTRLFRS